MKYRIGTRGSKLAMIQAGFVKTRLDAAYPDDTFEIVEIRTRGDRVTDRPIAAIGDNALFTREIEIALQERRIDLAVHSMKDLPADCAEDLCLAKAWPREDPRDALVCRDGIRSLAELPQGATVATGSPRRDLLLRRMRPDLNVVGIRGNVDTRLRKLFAPAADEPKLDALVLAAAGLKRLGRADVITQDLDEDAMIPAPNQGQLAIEVRTDDVGLKAKVDALGNDEAEAVASAERGFLREIGADCHMPVGALARAMESGISLRCVFAKDVGATAAFAAVVGETPEEAARKAVREICRQVAGEVTLVGAGPGDPDLITVKGLAAIKAADAIVYDRLISEDLLKNAKPGCELIYVGKASGNHTLPQEEINALLAKKAMTCPKVVRLKGGDPFVFGRGGEEADYLHTRGIRCRVIPGVTSAIAAPASFGIPVTHRGVASGFEVVTAHAKGDEPLDIDFSRLCDPKRTYVFLMGLGRIAEISAALAAAGRDAETPAAVISSATMPGARCVTGTLADIAAKVSRAALVSPAILVVGETVRLRGRLGFPLSGRRFLVPEIEGGRNRLTALLEALGAGVDVLPVGRIVPCSDAIGEKTLEDVTWLAFTSRNGLLPFEGRLAGIVKAHGIRIAAIGKATAGAVKELGLAVDFVAKETTGDGMLAELGAVLRPCDRVLHPTAEGIRDSLADLATRCAYSAVGVYRNEEIPVSGQVDLSHYDAAFFTCASSARRTLARAKGGTRAFAIGPATERTLRELGVADVVVAAATSPEALVQAALESLKFKV